MTTCFIIWIIMVFSIFVFGIVICLKEEIARARERARERARRARKREIDAELTYIIEKAQKTLLAELNQQKQEIEKQVFKEDEYNFCVAQQIIETMCLQRLRKEYSDHFYMVYKKVLEDIEIVKNSLPNFGLELILEEYYGENIVDNIYKNLYNSNVNKIN